MMLALPSLIFIAAYYESMSKRIIFKFNYAFPQLSMRLLDLLTVKKVELNKDQIYFIKIYIIQSQRKHFTLLVNNVLIDFEYSRPS